MKWEVATIDQYVQAKAFVDTALIPLVDIELGDEIESAVTTSAFVTGVANKMEEQLKGRVLLLPAMTTISDESFATLYQRINAWHSYLKQQGFKNVVFLTQNTEWIERQTEVDSAILVLDSAPESLDLFPQEVSRMTKKTVTMLIEIWQKG
ncbi:DUF2487 family protein [Caldalkalibacillus salinus]|uniref:DUF2487 family protein n=1 Tax=Caldalkalibacillus salinus TaxID=2803787 RepID=UPI00192328F6|nr:DUF2487 family protein [Caldalkalibacillus salinus]